MPRKLIKLRIDEVSSVRRGAGEGVNVVLMKRDADDEDIVTRGRKILRQLAINYHNEDDMQKISDQELFDSWWSELSAEERRRFRRRQALIEDRVDAQERANRVETTPRRDVAGRFGQGELSETERAGYGSGRRKSDDTLRKIAKDFGGVAKLAKYIVSDGNAHSITEAELVELAREEAEATGQTVGKKLLTDATLQKACAIARDAEFSRAAQRNILDARMRSRTAQLNY